jgi:hypothetical protein
MQLQSCFLRAANVPAADDESSQPHTYFGLFAHRSHCPAFVLKLPGAGPSRVWDDNIIEGYILCLAG